MKAIWINNWGGPEELVVKEIALPSVGSGDIYR
jgi:NADPH:quinone reductase-like Zn-dependent oxidoreductase